MEEWRESGLTARQFATENGLKAENLYRWSWAQRRSSAQAENQDQFMEVRLTPSRPVRQGGTSSGFEVVLSNGRTIRVHGDFDRERLRSLVEALESC